MEFPDDGCSLELKCTDHYAVYLGVDYTSSKNRLAVFPQNWTAAWLGATPFPRPRSRPQGPQPGGSEGTPARLRAQSRAKGPHAARNCPGNHCARTRKCGAGRRTELRALRLEEGFTLPLDHHASPGGRARRPSPPGGASLLARARLAR